MDLVRIRTLADAGVPLARIDALLHAQPTEFAAAITDIDTALQTCHAGSRLRGSSASWALSVISVVLQVGIPAFGDFAMLVCRRWVGYGGASP
ncbi:hypothetical protein [Nocardia sp. NPDC004604]|uniref:hypothetical protein n=1 Tax=Nocardia sp. NPDC004604 TaxID=3157013 RepID=UPI0033B9D741